MLNNDINCMSIAINKFTNVVNVESSDIHKLNCAWEKGHNRT